MKEQKHQIVLRIHECKTLGNIRDSWERIQLHHHHAPNQKNKDPQSHPGACLFTVMSAQGRELHWSVLMTQRLDETYLAYDKPGSILDHSRQREWGSWKDHLLTAQCLPQHYSTTVGINLNQITRINLMSYCAFF